jgi:hypothetical protein
MLYYVHPSRVREVWSLKVPFLKFFKTKVYQVVYWDVNDYYGMSWPLEEDRKTEPNFTSLYSLVNNGWKLENDKA